MTYVVIPVWSTDHAPPAHAQEAYRANASESAGSGADAVVVRSLGPSALALAGRRWPRRHPLAAPGWARSCCRPRRDPAAAARAAAIPACPPHRLGSLRWTVPGGLASGAGTLPAPSKTLSLAYDTSLRDHPLSAHPRRDPSFPARDLHPH